MVRAAVYNRLRELSSFKTRQWIKRQPWFLPVSRAVFGNTVYCESYYADVERHERKSVEHIGEWIVANLAPKRLIDVGCGPGHMMMALSKRGVGVFGVDVSDAAVAIVTKQKGLEAVKFDLTRPDTELPGRPYDLAISCEVAEHLDGRYARRFVEHLTGAAPVVYMTAGEPAANGQVGLYHVNEQPHSYWIALFKERGFELDEAATASAREYFKERTVCYLARPLVFRKRA